MNLLIQSVYETKRDLPINLILHEEFQACWQKSIHSQRHESIVHVNADVQKCPYATFKLFTGRVNAVSDCLHGALRSVIKFMRPTVRCTILDMNIRREYDLIIWCRTWEWGPHLFPLGHEVHDCSSSLRSSTHCFRYIVLQSKRTSAI
jgi:hypothetical protein